MWRKIAVKDYSIRPRYNNTTGKLDRMGRVIVTLDCGHVVNRYLTEMPKNDYIHCRECKIGKSGNPK